MGIFVGTLIITGLCCLVMGLVQIVNGKPLSGGCGHKPEGSAKCDSCPNRKTAGDN